VVGQTCGASTASSPGGRSVPPGHAGTQQLGHVARAAFDAKRASLCSLRALLVPVSVAAGAGLLARRNETSLWPARDLRSLRGAGDTECSLPAPPFLCGAPVGCLPPGQARGPAASGAPLGGRGQCLCPRAAAPLASPAGGGAPRRAGA